MASYEQLHPTNFDWHPAVEERVHWIQGKHPWMTYVNSYYDHPPDDRVPRRWPVDFYSRKSMDVWGGGMEDGKYTGYRGKPLPKGLGDQIHHELFWAKRGPEIDWIIWSSRMWWNPKTGGPGWTSSPPGPPDSDPQHLGHIHITYRV